jgi:ABC-type multidrug transport system fused ATPase/permease subunit
MSRLHRIAAMSPIALSTVKDWAQTIVLVGSVVVSCVVLVFKFGGYATRIEDAIKDATALGTQAVQENVGQQKAIDALLGAEERRQKAEDKADERLRQEMNRGAIFNEWPSVKRLPAK